MPCRLLPLVLALAQAVHRAEGDVPRCEGGHTGPRPFCFPVDYNKVGVAGIAEICTLTTLITYLSHLRRGTLSQCRSPAGEAFKKKKNHVLSMVGRWGDPGLVQKCVLLHVTNLSHFL